MDDFDQSVLIRRAVDVHVVDDPLLIIAFDDVVNDTINGVFNEILHKNDSCSHYSNPYCNETGESLSIIGNTYSKMSTPKFWRISLVEIRFSWFWIQNIKMLSLGFRT